MSSGRSERTRYLWVASDGKPALAPAVRTFQLALMLGMGREWFIDVMAATESKAA